MLAFSEKIKVITVQFLTVHEIIRFLKPVAQNQKYLAHPKTVVQKDRKDDLDLILHLYHRHSVVCIPGNGKSLEPVWSVAQPARH